MCIYNFIVDLIQSQLKLIQMESNRNYSLACLEHAKVHCQYSHLQASEQRLARWKTSSRQRIILWQMSMEKTEVNTED